MFNLYCYFLLWIFTSIGQAVTERHLLTEFLNKWESADDELLNLLSKLDTLHTILTMYQIYWAMNRTTFRQLTYAQSMSVLHLYKMNVFLWVFFLIGFFNSFDRIPIILYCLWFLTTLTDFVVNFMPLCIIKIIKEPSI